MNENYKLIFILFFNTILFLSCSTNLVEKDNFKLLNLDNLKEGFKNENQALNEKILNESKTYELTDKEFELLNNLVEKSIENYNSSVSNDSDKIDFRRYKWFGIPLVNINGDKMIYIKSYKSNSSENWDDFIKIHEVKDSGNSILSLLINLTYERFGMIRLNAGT